MVNRRKDCMQYELASHNRRPSTASLTNKVVASVKSFLILNPEKFYCGLKPTDEALQFLRHTKASAVWIKRKHAVEVFKLNHIMWITIVYTNDMLWNTKVRALEMDRRKIIQIYKILRLWVWNYNYLVQVLSLMQRCSYWIYEYWKLKELTISQPNLW